MIENEIKEVWFLILHLLMEYQLTSCAKILEQELIENNLLLQGHDWKGGLQKRSYEELVRFQFSRQFYFSFFF